MSPELLSKYEKQLADMRSEKGLMTGLSFLSGVLGARTPWMSQALSEGGIQALGTYGKYADDESRLQQGMLEQQMGMEKAPFDLRQKAGLELLSQQAAGTKAANELKKTLAAAGLRYQGQTESANIRNRGNMDKAAYDRATRLAVEGLRQQLKGAPDRNKARTAAIQTLASNVQFFNQLDPRVQAQMVDDVTDQFLRASGTAGSQNMGRIGGAGQQQIFNLQ
jgi:hypothetical protein